ncbi:classical arabinogalactan protein 10-like [Abrus precatorius]|uniref:Classical arabinogalactan protein 10-like n=1 Tax=Abrus precatorius TaxID=3816 RepID=A0A8B8M9Z4_ABRPR|nr:classical arabinogalactan protein 10-like [Abrus precatorius]
MKERGVYFFICSISNYCCLGQKIAISVHERAPENPPPLPPSSLSPSPSPSPSQVPITSPQLSPKGSAPQPHGTNPPLPSTTTPRGNGSNSPMPSSTQGGKSNAVALVCGKSFIVSLGQLLSMLVTFLGFWVM